MRSRSFARIAKNFRKWVHRVPPETVAGKLKAPSFLPSLPPSLRLSHIEAVVLRGQNAGVRRLLSPMAGTFLPSLPPSFHLSYAPFARACQCAGMRGQVHYSHYILALRETKGCLSLFVALPPIHAHGTWKRLVEGNMQACAGYLDLWRAPSFLPCRQVFI